MELHARIEDTVQWKILERVKFDEFGKRTIVWQISGAPKEFGAKYVGC